MTRLLDNVIHYVFSVLAVLLISYLIIAYVGQRTEVIGNSMYPTLENSDQLIVNKLIYKLSDPKRYDVVVFPCKGEYYVKRVIGLPGETVRINSDGVIFINEQVLPDVVGIPQIQDAGVAWESITLGENEYFVLGDNRNHSSDSRDPSVGNISRDLIVGKVSFRVFPLPSIGLVN